MKKSSDEGLFPADWALERRLAALAGAGIYRHRDELSATARCQLAAVRRILRSFGTWWSRTDSPFRRGAAAAQGQTWAARTRACARRLSKRSSGFLNAVSELGTDAVLMVLGHVTEEIRHDQAIDIARSVVTEILPIAERTGVRLCIEPVWPKFGGSFIEPLGLRDFIDSFDNEFVRAYFDVGNVLVWTYPQHWIRILGNRIYRVHVKDFKTGIGNISGVHAPASRRRALAAGDGGVSGRSATTDGSPVSCRRCRATRTRGSGRLRTRWTSYSRCRTGRRTGGQKRSVDGAGRLRVRTGDLRRRSPYWVA